jgi:chaperonin GroEL (HSP60 family)
LRAAHEKSKGYLIGVDVFSGEVIDMFKNGVIEPVRVKEHAVKSATEVSSMILRIDDVIAGSKMKDMPKGPEGPEDED